MKKCYYFFYRAVEEKITMGGLNGRAKWVIYILKAPCQKLGYCRLKKQKDEQANNE